MSCKNNAEKSEASSIQNNNNSDFDIEAATKIVEQRSKEFEDALKTKILKHFKELFEVEIV